jgi:hypothetical protein
MSSGLAATTARRVALQARCAEQRSALQGQLGAIEDGIRPVDRAIHYLQTYGPLLAVAGIVALIVIGPGKALRATRNVLVVAPYAAQALRLFR